METAQLNQYWYRKVQLTNMKCSICEKSMRGKGQGWMLKLEVRKVEIGGARQAAVESRPMHVWKFYQLKSWSPNTYFSNKFTGSRMRPILKDQVGWEVKWSCFKGIDSWGTSLSIKLILSLFFIMIMMLVMMMMRLMIILRNVQRKMWILCRT